MSEVGTVISSVPSTVSSKLPPIGAYSNHIKFGLVGMPNSGKSTLFNMFIKSPDKFAPTDGFLFCTIDPYIGSFIPDDRRFDFLSKMFRPSASSPSRISIIDTAGLVTGSYHEDNGVGTSSVQSLVNADVILHVLRYIDDENINHYSGHQGTDPCRDSDVVNGELLLLDLFVIETALTEIEHILQRLLGGDYVRFQFDTLLKAYSLLAGSARNSRPKVVKRNAIFHRLPLPTVCKGVGIRFGAWEPTERELLSTFKLITAKPVVYLLNMSPRDYLRTTGHPDALCQPLNELRRVSAHVTASGHAGEVLPCSAVFEQRLYELSLQGQDVLEEYLHANATHSSALPAIISTVYTQLRIIHFYTASEKEVKCWCLRKGSTILESAECVDAGVARNFLRGEVISFNDFHHHGGDRLKVMMDGKLKAETKKYIVNDGDIIEFFWRGK